MLEAFERTAARAVQPEELIDLAPAPAPADAGRDLRAADDFDVVHSHLDIWTFPFTLLREVPTVLTMHGRLDLDFLRRPPCPGTASSRWSPSATTNGGPWRTST